MPRIRLLGRPTSYMFRCVINPLSTKLHFLEIPKTDNLKSLLCSLFLLLFPLRLKQTKDNLRSFSGFRLLSL